MNSEAIKIEAPYTLNELVSKLKAMSVEDFDMIRNSPQADYYGDITSHSFNIKHVRYGPMSYAPSIQGDIIEGVNNRTIIKLKMEIREPFELVRKMYYGTLLPIGAIVMLLSLLVMGGTEFQWQSLILSSSFIIIAFLAVALQRKTLMSIKRKELKTFVAKIEGHLIPDVVEDEISACDLLTDHADMLKA
ncbi:MAG: hypothetical protein DWP98_11240 [Bacteroidetes bacterium]|nr:MAG: hypothetical protein DWP98_11240 [Bacteroidota bacterium]MBL1145227.1 hypothetical protein [Bacteroidota bacterium]MCB0802945.1 hypothetical protein [Flavobacteriales bacterium]NOG58023.1 hypothetical protein [Bacteroidota bacterium]